MNAEEKILKALDRLTELNQQGAGCWCHADICFARDEKCCKDTSFVPLDNVRDVLTDVVTGYEKEQRRLKSVMKERHKDYAKTIKELSQKMAALWQTFCDQHQSDILSGQQHDETEKEKEV